MVLELGPKRPHALDHLLHSKALPVRMRVVRRMRVGRRMRTSVAQQVVGEKIARKKGSCSQWVMENSCSGRENLKGGKANRCRWVVNV